MRTTLTSAAAALLVLGSGVPLAAQSASTSAPANASTPPVAQQGAAAQPAATTPAARLAKSPASASIPRSSLISQPSKPMRSRMMSWITVGDRVAGRSASHAV